MLLDPQNVRAEMPAEIDQLGIAGAAAQIFTDFCTFSKALVSTGTRPILLTKSRRG
jgi:hypothetical protein